ncbi:lysis protein [Ewingella docleensis]|uniref:lysis protein n=1 Tax=Ewingella docleensis TaxID=3118588 RepID=UPI003F5B17CB
MSKIRLTPILIIIMACLLFGVSYYQGQVAKLKHDVAEISQVAKEHQATIDLMTARNKLAAELDIKYAKELADAKSENDRLRADVESGAKRLRINATCKAPNASATSSVDDATSPRLNDSAQRDYLNLRERIGTATKQIAGLQDYITNICLK